MLREESIEGVAISDGNMDGASPTQGVLDALMKSAGFRWNRGLTGHKNRATLR